MKGELTVSELIAALQEFKDKHGDLPVRLQDDDCGMWPLHHVEHRSIVNIFKPDVFDACGLMIPPEEWDDTPSGKVNSIDPALVKLTIFKDASLQEGKEVKILKAIAFGPYHDWKNYSIDILAEWEE